MSDDAPESTRSPGEPAPAAPPEGEAASASEPAAAPTPPDHVEPAEPGGVSSNEAPPLALTSPAPVPVRATSPLRRFAFLAIPAIAILELGAHLLQTHDVVTEAQWLAARDAVRAIAQPADLVAVAPYWSDPLAREYFKEEILTIAREARPDETRFPRAVEVSMRGAHLPELAQWKVESKKRVGPFTVTVLDNPSFTPVLDDLVDHVEKGKMTVSANGTECGFSHGRVETGGLGFGPAVPADRFVCPQGGSIGATVMMPADYRPHRCLFAPPIGGGKALRVKFENVTFGDVLHGHAGIDWDSTAHPEEPPVTLVWKLGDHTLGRIVAGNNDGWKSFALDTRDVKGQKGEIIAEVSSPSSRNRLYCFEADTR